MFAIAAEEFFQPGLVSFTPGTVSQLASGKDSKGYLWKCLDPFCVASSSQGPCPENSMGLIFLEWWFVSSDLTGLSFSVLSWFLNHQLETASGKTMWATVGLPSSVGIFVRDHSGAMSENNVSYILSSFPFVCDNSCYSTSQELFLPIEFLRN